MRREEATQDGQGKAFGAAPGRDQDIVDTHADKGGAENELPDEATHHPHAGGKAEPTDASAGNATGESKAEQNREEDPPA
jgi:hypothetical protein